MNAQNTREIETATFINLKGFLITISLACLLISTKAFAIKIGGNGGVQTSTLSCPNSQLLTGITAMKSEAVEQIKLRCHRYDGHQKWSGSARWSSFSGTTNPRPSRRQQSLLCPRDKWVTKISGVTKQGVISSIKITCSELNESTGIRNKRLQATDSEDFSFGNQGSWLTHSCESRTYNSGVVASILSRYGWKLDSITPKCDYFRIKPVTPTTVSPSFSNNRLKSIAASPSQAQFTARNRGGDYGDYCISEVNQGRCILRFSEEHPGWHESPVEKAIPTSLQGQTLEWKMRNCDQGNPASCGEWSAKTKFFVLPQSTQISNLRRNQQLLSRNILLKWKNSAQADSYRIMILDESVRNIPSFYDDPEMRDVPGKRQVIKMDRSRTSIRVNIDSRLSGKIKVKIAACKTTADVGRQCHESATLLPLMLPAKTNREKGG